MRSGWLGLSSRRIRTTLTASGIAIGIAAIVAVLGISTSSKADLLAQIDLLGTNLLTVEAGMTPFGEPSNLPSESPEMIRRIAPVELATAVSFLSETVRRTTLIPKSNTSGIRVISAEAHLLETLRGEISEGRFLSATEGSLPTVVLGSVSAQRLGIQSLRGLPTVDIGGQTFSVIGIISPLPLHPDLDRAVFISHDAATTIFVDQLPPTRIYLRTHPLSVEAVRPILARTANPQSPNEVQVSQPSKALEARAAIDDNLNRLLLGLGSVALFVGAIGIANVMVITVLERRSEIGLRRAVGATRSHIAGQFLAESTILSVLGGGTGVLVGWLVTVGYAHQQGWPVVIPVSALQAALALSIAIGAIAGLYPAIRAASIDPAEAVYPVG